MVASGIYIGQEVVKQWGESCGGAVVCGGVRGGGWDESLGQESKLHCHRQVPRLPAQSPVRYLFSGVKLYFPEAPVPDNVCYSVYF